MKLHTVQLEALRRSTGLRGFAYFMEQGLGKTLTSYADFMDKVANGLATRMVVVCPNSFKEGWVEDAAKHDIDLDFFVWQAGFDNYVRSWMRRGFNKPPCLIVNWEAIRAVSHMQGKKKVWENGRVANLILEFIEDRDAMIVFDESIQAKGHDNAQSIGARMLSREFAFRRILSGKPTTQGPHDLWGQLKLIGLMEGRNYYAFRGAFCRMGGFKGKAVIGAQNEDILAEMIDPNVFRATKKEWAKELPPKLPPVIRDYKLTPEMAAMYNSMEKDFMLWLESGEAVTIDAAITKYIKLAQIQCGWIYDEEGKVNWLVDDAKNPRLNLLREIVDETNGKVLIPYNHKPVFQQLIRTFGEDSTAWITGGMEPKEIEEQKARFNKDPRVMQMVLQTKAAKYGHTLLGIQEDENLACKTMIFYENTYSLDDRGQIEDRPHRHGQLYPVSYFDLVGTSLDRNCVKALQRKEDLFQAVFSLIGRSRP